MDGEQCPSSLEKNSRRRGVLGLGESGFHLGKVNLEVDEEVGIDIIK